jgi:antitoxin VapB
VALTIQNPETERLARELAEKTGETVDSVLLSALRERNAKWQPKRFLTDGTAFRVLSEAQERFAELPVLDDRPPEELLGYDEWGLPH